MAIQRVNFGRLDAESDRDLADYFVDTGVLKRIAIGQRYLVIGRKGSGKTALFAHTDERKLGCPIRRLDFGNYSWDAHRKLREEGVFGEAAFQGSWRFTLLMIIVDHLAENGDAPTKKAASAIQTKLYGRERPTWKELLFDKLRRLRRLDLPEIEGMGGLGGIEFEEANSDAVLATGLSRWSQNLLTFVAKHFPACPVSLFLDRLDDAWDASDDSKAMLIGALKAAREINIALAQKGKAPAVLVFLRTDIFDLLLFNDKMKMAQDIEYLDWGEDSLCEILEARIASSLGVAKTKAWSAAFSGSSMRQRATIRSYMTRRTMYRPRDMIRFALCCQEKATAANHQVVETTDVYNGEIRYSQEMFDELIDEMHKQVPNARDVMEVLREVEAQRFKERDWIEAYARRFPHSSETDAKSALGVLFEFSVVGVPKAGGRAGGTKFQFRYEDRLLRPNFTSQMVVHSGLKKVLSLKDRGA